MKNNNSIREKVYAVIAENADKSEKINLDEAFEAIGIGSLCFVKIMVELENQFLVEINDEYYTNEYKSIGEFIDKITNYLADGIYYGN